MRPASRSAAPADTRVDVARLREKVGVVGAGLVGSTSVFAMVMRGVGREVVLVDVNRAGAEAEATEIFHAVPFAHRMTVCAGDYPDLEDAHVVVTAGGVAQQPGETRLQLLQRNDDGFRQIAPSVVQAAPEALLLIVTNPVDIMTHVAAQLAAEQGVAASRVLGFGTTLDTARFRALLGRHFDVDPQYVHGYVIGEHGDSEVLIWSQATIAGLGLDAFATVHGTPLTPQDVQRIDNNVRRAADHIIAGKRATYYGIGSAVADRGRLGARPARDSHGLRADQRVPVGEGVTLALPRLVGGDGVLATIPLAMAHTEREGLRQSAGILRDAVASLRLGSS